MAEFKDERPSWDEYFMQMAELTSKRSTCLRRQVGAVIIKDKHIIATGYNGAPRGVPHCSQKGGCLREQLKVPSGERHELCRALHAEQNAIIQAATLGQSIEGGSIFVTHHPCSICSKMIVNAGVVLLSEKGIRISLRLKFWMKQAWKLKNWENRYFYGI